MIKKYKIIRIDSMSFLRRAFLLQVGSRRPLCNLIASPSLVCRLHVGLPVLIKLIDLVLVEEMLDTHDFLSLFIPVIHLLVTLAVSLLLNFLLLAHHLLLIG